jgi:hypothetical protein
MMQMMMNETPQCKKGRWVCGFVTVAAVMDLIGAAKGALR